MESIKGSVSTACGVSNGGWRRSGRPAALRGLLRTAGGDSVGNAGVGAAVLAAAVEWWQPECRRRPHEQAFHAYLSPLRIGRVVLAMGARRMSAATRTSIVRFLRRKT